MDNDAFNESLAVGHSGEMRIAEAFKSAGYEATISNSDSFWDLWVVVDNEPYTLEVKNEDAYADGDNLCVEIYQGKNHHLSGIAISKAYSCVHTLGEKCCAYRTIDILRWLRYESGLKMELFSLADNHNGGFLVPRSMLYGQLWCVTCQIERLPKSRLFHRNGIGTKDFM